MPDSLVFSVYLNRKARTYFLHKFRKEFGVSTCSYDKVKMCFHDTVSEDFDSTLFVVFV